MALEGGYNLEAIAESALSVFNSLLSNRIETKQGAVSENKEVKKRVEEIKEVQRKYWPSLCRENEKWRIKNGTPGKNSKST